MSNSYNMDHSLISNFYTTGLIAYFELRITGLSQTHAEPDSDSLNSNLDKLKFSSVARYLSFWTNEHLDKRFCFHI